MTQGCAYRVGQAGYEIHSAIPLGWQLENYFFTEEDPEKLVAFAGIDPVVYQTGQFEATNTRMSKRGSPYLRHALWQAAFAASRFDPQLRDYYQRKRAEGKAHGTALGALCRKLLHRIYIILKEERPYVIRD